MLISSLTLVKTQQETLLASLAAWEAAGSAPEAFSFPWSERFGLTTRVDFDALCVAASLETRLARRSLACDLIETVECLADIIKPPPGHKPEDDELVPKCRLKAKLRYVACQPYCPPTGYVPPRILRPKSAPVFGTQPLPDRKALGRSSTESSDSLPDTLFPPHRKASLLFRLRKKWNKFFQPCHEWGIRPQTPEGCRRVELDNWPKKGLVDSQLDWAAAQVLAQRNPILR